METRDVERIPMVRAPPAGGSAAKLPSFRLAMERAKAHLLHDPMTEQPYPYHGLFAPLKVFERIGEDAALMMRLGQDGFVVAVVCTLLSIWPMLILA